MLHKIADAKLNYKAIKSPRHDNETTEDSYAEIKAIVFLNAYEIFFGKAKRVVRVFETIIFHWKLLRQKHSFLHSTSKV